MQFGGIVMRPAKRDPSQNGTECLSMNADVADICRDASL